MTTNGTSNKTFKLINDINVLCNKDPLCGEEIYQIFNKEILEIYRRRESLCCSNIRKGIERIVDMVFFLEELGYTPNWKYINVDLERLFRDRSGNCVEMTILFIMFSREMGLQSFPVQIPGHLFCRVLFRKRHVNIECMDWGKFKSDKEYIISGNITKEQLSNGIYMTNMDDSELLSLVTHNVYFDRLISGSPIAMKAREDLREAFVKGENLAELYNSLAINYIKRKKYTWAQKHLISGLKKDDNSLILIESLIQLQILKEDYSQAIEIANHAMQRNITSNVIKLKLSVAYCRIGQYGKTKAILKNLLSADCREEKFCSAVQAYLACVHYFCAEYKESAKHSLIYVSTKGNGIGVVWAAMAFLNNGSYNGETAEYLKKVLKENDGFEKHMVEILFSEGCVKDLYSDYPERIGEINCYIGEYYSALKDIDKAIYFLKKCIKDVSINTYEHLRAHRLYKDIEARVSGLNCMTSL